MAAKKKKKKAKKARGGHRKGHKRASTAKRGAAKRHTLKVGTIVTKKPNKKSLAKHKLKATPVGTVNGKKAYKIQRKKVAKPTARAGYAAAMRGHKQDVKKAVDAKKAEEKALKAKWRAVIALKKRAEKLGLSSEIEANAKLAAQYQALIDAKAAEVARAKANAEAELEAAREESRSARQSYDD